MNRILLAAAPFVAAAMLVAGPVSATTAKKVSCKQIHAELQAGKTPAEVAKDLKISTKDIDHCNAKVASNKKHMHSQSSGAHPAPAAPAQ